MVSATATSSGTEKARKANPVRLIGPNDPQCFALEMEDDKEDECHHPD